MATTATPQDDIAAKGAAATKDQAAPKAATIQAAGTGPARQTKPESKAAADSKAKSKPTAKDSKPEPKESKAVAGQPTNAAGSLTGLRTEINHLFDGFVSGVGRAPALFRSYEPAWRLSRRRMPKPAVDMIEDDKLITLTAELPGLGEEDIEVVLRDGMLTIKGEKKTEHEEKKDSYFLSERRYGAFERSFRLPGEADADKIAARFDKGILTVTVPCKTAAKPGKKIRIEAK